MEDVWNQEDQFKEKVKRRSKMTICIHGRYNEGYEDGYKNGVNDTLNEIEILIEELDATDECKDIIKKKIKEIEK